jgi:hypothetical protein
LIFLPILDPGVKRHRIRIRIRNTTSDDVKTKVYNFQGVVLLPPSQEEKAEAAATATAPVLLGQFRNERCCIRCEEVGHRIR